MKTKEINISDDLIEKLNKETSLITKKRISAKMKIAAIIDDERKRHNWNKNDLARVLKKHPSEISKWLSGTHNFTLDTIIEIQETLNIKILLLDRTENIHNLQWECHVVAPSIPAESWTFICNPELKIHHLKSSKLYQTTKQLEK